MHGEAISLPYSYRLHYRTNEKTINYIQAATSIQLYSKPINQSISLPNVQTSDRMTNHPDNAHARKPRDEQINIADI